MAWDHLAAFLRSYLLEQGGCPIPRDLWAKADPEDLVQEALRQFHKSFRLLRDPTLEEALAFLRHIWKQVWRILQRAYRYGKRNTDREVVEADAVLHRTPSTGLTPLEEMIRREDRAQLAGALAQLPEDDRHLIRWHYLDRLTFTAIGLRLACSEGAAQQRHLKILERLRGMLELAGR
jgi:RNA polymerase sigma factor (sigma-70 family)